MVLSAKLKKFTAFEPRKIRPVFMEDKEFEELFPANKMTEKKDRLLTFVKMGWNSTLSTKVMANAGFCYTGTTDEVVCYKCRGVISNWSKFEVPIRLHKKVYPTCDFVINLPENEIRRRTTKFDGSQQDTDSGEISDEEDGMEFFLSEFNRLMSFEKWPLSSPVDRYDLAATGFYCVDGTSEVICVGCGKEVSDWKLGDRPKEKHQVVNGMPCPFANNKGSEKVDMDVVEIKQFIRRCLSS